MSISIIRKGMSAALLCTAASFAFAQCPGEGSCCEPNGTVGCDDEKCCNLICAADPFCCDTEWDGICADAANMQCDVCNQPGACCLPDGSCVEAAGPQDCAGLFQGSGTDCAEVDCPEPEVCPKGTIPEGEPCGQDPDVVNGGCNSTPNVFSEANCGDVICGVAWAEGGTRDTDWYEFVAEDDVFLIVTLDAPFDPLFATVTGVCDGPVIDQDGSATGELVINATAGETVYVFVGTAGFDGVPCGSGMNQYIVEFSCSDTAPTGACCLPDLSCVATDGPGPCQDMNGEFQGIGTSCKEVECAGNPACGPDAGDCCSPNGSVGCNDAECCNVICSQDPFCCDVEWDQICADAAIQQCAVCQEPGACCLPDGACAETDGPADCADQGGVFQGAGTLCEGITCTGACCFLDGSCIDTGQGDCVAMGGTFQGFGTECKSTECPMICPGKGDCCTPNGSPGCNDADCCAVVCAADPFCCDVEWDQICADAAIELCDVCQQPGACCLFDGSCVEAEGPLDCAEQGGVFQGAGTTCEKVTCPQPPECPKGGILEGEPCGQDPDVVNGGCNSTPNVFTQVNCEDTICGIAWAEGGTRDTDWFEITVDEETDITVTLDALFDPLFATIEGVCDAPVIGIDGSATGVITTTLPAGSTTYFFVATAGFEGVPCGSGMNDYTLTFDCGAICVDISDCPDIDGSGFVDSPDLNEVLGGFGCVAEEDQVCQGDVNCDGLTDSDDLNDVLGAFGEQCINEGDECGFCIEVGEGVFEGTTADNTGKTGDDTSCTFMDTIDEWYCYTASCDGVATANTCGNDAYDTALAAFDACDGAEIACNDDTCGLQSQITWPVTAGTTYFIRVSGFSMASGDYTLEITCGDAPPPPDACAKDAGDCCAPNGTPGCDQIDCCASVCAADAFCCNTEWDQICADAALENPDCDCP